MDRQNLPFICIDIYSHCYHLTFKLPDPVAGMGGSLTVTVA